MKNAVRKCVQPGSFRTEKPQHTQRERRSRKHHTSIRRGDKVKEKKEIDIIWELIEFRQRRCLNK